MRALDTPEGPELALAFLNTTPSPDDPVDRLGTPSHLLEWLCSQGLGAGRLPAMRASPPEAADLLREARRLRDAAGAVLAAFCRRIPLHPDDLHGVDRALSAGSVTRHVRVGPGGPRIVETEGAGDLRAALVPVALGVAELLQDADPRRVRRCAAPACRGWFLDTSKGGRRKWCSMARCGNRAKAARHRRKVREEGVRST